MDFDFEALQNLFSDHVEICLNQKQIERGVGKRPENEDFVAFDYVLPFKRMTQDPLENEEFLSFLSLTTFSKKKTKALADAMKLKRYLESPKTYQAFLDYGVSLVEIKEPTPAIKTEGDDYRYVSVMNLTLRIQSNYQIPPELQIESIKQITTPRRRNE